MRVRPPKPLNAIVSQGLSKTAPKKLSVLGKEPWALDSGSWRFNEMPEGARTQQKTSLNRREENDFHGGGWFAGNPSGIGQAKRKMVSGKQNPEVHLCCFFKKKIGRPHGGHKALKAEGRGSWRAEDTPAAGPLGGGVGAGARAGPAGEAGAVPAQRGVRAVGRWPRAFWTPSAAQRVVRLPSNGRDPERPWTIRRPNPGNQKRG